MDGKKRDGDGKDGKWLPSGKQYICRHQNGQFSQAEKYLYYNLKANMSTSPSSYSFFQVGNYFMPVCWNPLPFMQPNSLYLPHNGVGERLQYGHLYDFPHQKTPKIEHFNAKREPQTPQLKNLQENESIQQIQKISCCRFKKETKAQSNRKSDQEPKAIPSQSAQAKNLHEQAASQVDVNDAGKTSWSPEEEQKLKQMVNLFGKRWKYISQHFPNRSGKQIRERYLNYLRPNLSLKKWAFEEDQEILRLVAKYGRSWRTIEKKLKNRSQNQIKNRYYGHLQKNEKTLLSFVEMPQAQALQNRELKPVTLTHISECYVEEANNQHQQV